MGFGLMSQKLPFLFQLCVIFSSLGQSDEKQGSLTLTSRSRGKRGLESNPSYLQGVSLRKMRNGIGKVDKQENLLFSWGWGRGESAQLATYHKNCVRICVQVSEAWTALSRTGEVEVGPEGEGEGGVPSRGTSCHQMLPESLKEQRLSSLGISLREKPAMPVVRVVKGRVSGF